jgi:hypothetical protein
VSDSFDGIVQQALNAVDRSSPEEVEILFREVSRSGRQARRQFCERLLAAFSIEAARSVDAGNYARQHNLFDCLRDRTLGHIEEEQIHEAFRQEGADLELSPTVVGRRRYSMLQATRG